MKEIQNVQLSDFTNEIAAKICEPLRAAMPIFTERKQGATFRATVFLLAETFKEDRTKILFYFFPEMKQPKKSGGGAKIIRPQDEKRSKIVKAPCDGCPGNAGFITDLDRKAIADKTASPKKQSFTINPDQNPFKSIEDIIDRFEGKAMAMKAFCQDREIELHPSITKATTIAKRIFAHYTNLNDEKSEDLVQTK